MLVSGCSTRPILEKEESQFVDVRKEYNNLVKVVEVAPDPTQSVKKKSKIKEKAAKTDTKSDSTAKPGKKDVKRKPPIEDSEGFDGRRPVVDPFRAGENITINIKYWNMSAGKIQISVEPFKVVNGKSAYHFKMKVDSNPRFSMFYSVSNWAETFMDFENMTPMTLTIDNNESSRVVESRTFFDWKTNKASLWEKEVSKKRGEKKKELHWDIEPFSQNVISTIYYLRTFTLSPGKTIKFNLTDDGKNYVFIAKVLRREVIDTDLGKMNTIVVSPEFQADGHYKQTGENLLWFTDDDRKFLVKVTAKIKIGSLYGEVESLKKE